MIFTDADNTLWDTNKVYADAQLALIQHVEEATGERVPVSDRLEYLREVDQDLALHHHAGLRYPPALLATALALYLKGMTRPSAVKTTLKQGWSALADFPAVDIERAFLSDLQHLAELRPGVFSGLERLYASGYSITLVTEGHKNKCQQLLEHHQLQQFITRIVESKKTVELYRRLRNLDTTTKVVPVMIGDQLDRDIAPAKMTGFTTIYFPGHFVPKWTPDESTIEPDYRVKSFDEAASIILRTRIQPQHDASSVKLGIR